MQLTPKTRFRRLAAAGAALLALLPAALASANRNIRFPDIPGYLTLKADFHQHTVFSDGRVWPNVRVEECVRCGLDAMAVTDHLEWQPHGNDLPHPDRNRGFELAQLAASLPAGMSEGDYWIVEQYRRGRSDLVKAQDTLQARPPGAEREAPSQTIIVVAGVEITRNQPLGHVNALFVTDANRLLEADPIAVLREASRQGAFLFWNHPWAVGRSDKTGVARLSETHSKLFDEGLIQGIEVVNGDVYSPEAFQIALDRGLTLFVNRDVHGLIDWDYPPASQHRPITLLFARAKTAAALREAMIERRTIVWYKNTLIGRQEWIEPTIRASLTAHVRGYKPDRRKFTIQVRPDTTLLDVELRNASDAHFHLRHVGPYTLASATDVLSVPPHASVQLTFATQERQPEARLRFEVLNALIAPGRHPILDWTLPAP